MAHAYQDKVVWITGASSGIGEALAQEFARVGAQLVLSARRLEELERVRQLCTAPERHAVVVLDMSESAQFEAAVATVLARFGRIDVLINNAGISQRSLVQDTALAVDRRLMEVDFFGPVALTKAVLPQLQRQGQGQLVAVSSIVGRVATPYRSAYAAAKHALIGFYDALRAEVHAQGLQVSVVLPGFVRSHVSLSALVGDGSVHGVLDPAQQTAMAADVFARKAVAALARGEDYIVIAGARERLALYLGRLSPALLARLIRRLPVT